MGTIGSVKLTRAGCNIEGLGIPEPLRPLPGGSCIAILFGIIRPIGVRASAGVEEENRLADLGAIFLARVVSDVELDSLDDDAEMNLGVNMMSIESSNV